jgi:hypothetical protein
MNGYRPEELVGHSIDVLNTTEGTEEERAAYLNQLRAAGNFKLETFHRHRSLRKRKLNSLPTGRWELPMQIQIC